MDASTPSPPARVPLDAHRQGADRSRADEPADEPAGERTGEQGPGGARETETSPNDCAATRVLDYLKDRGYEVNFRPGTDPGTLYCDACGEQSRVGRFGRIREVRLEGASDPDDMVLVVGATCPSCDRRGTVVLSYGPAGSSTDTDIVAELPPVHDPDHPAGPGAVTGAGA